MTAEEFKQAFKIAADREQDLSEDALDPFFRFAMPDFKPITVTTRQVARLIRYQAYQLNGNWDSIALNEIRTAGRKKFIVVGDL